MRKKWDTYTHVHIYNKQLFEYFKQFGTCFLNSIRFRLIAMGMSRPSIHLLHITIGCGNQMTHHRLSVHCLLACALCLWYQMTCIFHCKQRIKPTKKNSWEIKTSFGCDWLQSQMKFETLATQVSSHLINAKIAWVMCEKKNHRTIWVIHTSQTVWKTLKMLSIFQLEFLSIYSNCLVFVIFPFCYAWLPITV